MHCTAGPGGSGALDFKLHGPVSRLRSGGLGMQVVMAGLHSFAHLSVAISLLLLLELGVEMCIRLGLGLGAGGAGARGDLGLWVVTFAVIWRKGTAESFIKICGQSKGIMAEPACYRQ